MTKDEIYYLIKQKHERKDLKLNKDQFIGIYQLVDKLEIQSLQVKVKASNGTDNQLEYWDEFEEEYGCIRTFNLPLISEDKKQVVLRSSLLCGLMCGGSSTVLYKLEEGRWQVDDVLEVEQN